MCIKILLGNGQSRDCSFSARPLSTRAQSAVIDQLFALLFNNWSLSVRGLFCIQYRTIRNYKFYHLSV